MIRGASPSIYVPGRLRAIPRRADPPRAFLRWFPRLAGSSINPLAASALAQAIQTQEGYYPGSVSYRNNNPGNLVYVGQAGATSDANGFAVFPTYQAGYNALVSQIQLDATRGTDAAGNPVTNIGQLISSWAPASDPRNDTGAYIASVTAQTGYDASTPLYLLGGPSSPPLPASLDNSGDAGLLQVLPDSSGDAGSGIPAWGWALAAGLAAFAFIR